MGLARVARPDVPIRGVGAIALPDLDPERAEKRLVDQSSLFDLKGDAVHREAVMLSNRVTAATYPATGWRICPDPIGERSGDIIMSYMDKK